MTNFIHGAEDFKCDGWSAPPMGFCDGCEDCLLEAWERMTYGGVQFGDLGPQYVHREWGGDTLGVSHGYQQYVWSVNRAQPS